METFDYVVISRSVERIIATLLGGGAIYWGYRIFLSLPNFSHIDDNFKFKKYLSFNSIKIAAGTLFLIFGAYIALATVLKTVSYNEKDAGVISDRPFGDTGNNENETSKSYSGVGDNQKRNLREDDMIDYNNLPGYFSTLNRVPGFLIQDIDPRDAREVQLSISRVKLNFMLSIWKPGEWGDKVAFRDWVIEGASGPKPETVKQGALDYFLIMKER